jgi:hypothetical protein
MRRLILSLAVAAAMTVPLAMGGCAVRARYYDADYHDYHTWNRGEEVYYVQWENETHRDHRDFRKRDKKEQQEYWDWRHHHEGDHH